MGSTFLMDLHDVSSTLFFWRKSVQIRHDGEFKKYPKEIQMKHPIIEDVEFDSLEELEVITDNSHALKMQVGIAWKIFRNLNNPNFFSGLTCE